MSVCQKSAWTISKKQAQGQSIQLLQCLSIGRRQAVGMLDWREYYYNQDYTRPKDYSFNSISTGGQNVQSLLRLTQQANICMSNKSAFTSVCLFCSELKSRAERFSILTPLSTHKIQLQQHAHKAGLHLSPHRMSTSVIYQSSISNHYRVRKQI